jgi:hypothetical protein
MLADDRNGLGGSNVVAWRPVFVERIGLEVLGENLLAPRESVSSAHEGIITDQVTPTSTTVSTHLDERLHLPRRRSGMKGRKRVLLIVVSVLLGSWLTLMSERRCPQRRPLRARWAGGVDLSMMPEAGALDPADEACREYERVVDAEYLNQIRTEAKQFSTKLLSRKSRVAECAIRNFKKGKNVMKPPTLRKLTRAIHALQNRKS